MSWTSTEAVVTNGGSSGRRSVPGCRVACRAGFGGRRAAVAPRRPGRACTRPHAGYKTETPRSSSPPAPTLPQSVACRRRSPRHRRTRPPRPPSRPACPAQRAFTATAETTIDVCVQWSLSSCSPRLIHSLPSHYKGLPREHRIRPGSLFPTCIRLSCFSQSPGCDFLFRLRSSYSIPLLTRMRTPSVSPTPRFAAHPLTHTRPQSRLQYHTVHLPKASSFSNSTSRT